MKMKRVLTVLLAVLLACGAFAAGSFAEEKQGLFQYEIKEDGTAEITGINDNNIEVLEIPAELDGIPVTSIRGYALWGCKSLQMVIPEGVVSVGHSAFSNCDRLESVSIPDSLVSAGDQPFGLCKNLKTVEVSPDHPVFAVENRALVNRQEQTLICVLDHEDTGTYTVAQGIRRIGGCAFDHCLFSAIQLPDGVTEIGSQAFSRCRNLTEMIIPEGVTDIGSQVFHDCLNIESVTFPDSVTQTGSAVFGDAPALTDVRISPDHPAYEMIGHLLVDKRYQEIVSALDKTPAVFEIPEGIRAIGNLAFQGSRDLTELIVPEGVTKIGWSAFNVCSKLRVITLPASLEEIGDRAFDNCAEDLLIRAPAGSLAEQYAGENGYRFEALPAADTDGAVKEEQSLFRYEIKEDGTAEITGINDTAIRTLEIPAELDGYPVTSIGDNAFMGCESLQAVVIPEGVVSVTDSAFWHCPALESVSIPDSLVSLGPQAFTLCGKLKNVEISPDHPVFAVENKALINRQEQTLITILDYKDAGTYTVAQGIRQIAAFAFDGASFSSIILPDGLTSVGGLAFGGCRNLTEMVFPEGVTEIGHQVFHGCVRLESVTFPDSVTRIGMSAFGNNPALTDVRISPDNPAYEMNGPLLVDKRDQEIVTVLSNMPATYEIPEGIRAIGQLAFQENRSLEQLIVPEGVTKIEWSAFNGCKNMREITLPASLEEIGTDAFEYCAEDLLIKAPAGSWAEQYAGENGYAFEALPADAD